MHFFHYCPFQNKEIRICYTVKGNSFALKDRKVKVTSKYFPYFEFVINGVTLTNLVIEFFFIIHIFFFIVFFHKRCIKTDKFMNILSIKSYSEHYFHNFIYLFIYSQIYLFTTKLFTTLYNYSRYMSC